MWKIEQVKEGDDKGKWYWMQIISSYGMVQGISPTKEEAERDLKIAWYDLTAGD